VTIGKLQRGGSRNTHRSGVFFDQPGIGGVRSAVTQSITADKRLARKGTQEGRLANIEEDIENHYQDAAYLPACCSGKDRFDYL
jgi:hypothetical protein